MSVRAVCLDATDDRLVLQATPQDVALFGRGQTLDVKQAAMREAQEELARAGWRPQPPREDASYISAMDAFEYMHGGRRSCTARLRTACGCERVLMVDWPPPRVVRVPTYQHVRLSALDGEGALALQDVQVRVREFRFRGEVKRDESGRPEPQYDEAMDNLGG